MNALIIPDQAIKRYGNAQGNILKGHGRENVTLLFVRFGDSAKARQWINQLVEQSGPTLPRIVSTEQQLREREKRQQEYSFDVGLFATLSFTAAGLGFLEVPAGQMPQEAVDQASFGRNGAFAAGMRAEATRRNLHDPDPADWDPGWWASGTEPSALHALLLLADANAARLQQAVAAVKEQLPGFEIRLMVEENGQRLFGQKSEKQENKKKEKQDIGCQDRSGSNRHQKNPHLQPSGDFLC
ncbi:hypothetical protein HNQ93_003023 [Hymenobacter luteus]|uniref:DyP dimeric alpha+beta barrel domain-containing protein n=2 Tax=Hymenobacter TaxID=89966 RepID=A0A7W9WDZ6_9BACT|nr:MULTISPECIES: hypothetical protein [Hymenobacter]MBB4603259.1 hypothetical protein [Hymenobacter latericoloratus]MBB6060157.1 hypothetical protein [Hymenobacter luteus]